LVPELGTARSSPLREQRAVLKSCHSAGADVNGVAPFSPVETSAALGVKLLGRGIHRMTINPQMSGKIIYGSVVIFCGHCGGPAIDAQSDAILKVCSTNGTVLGQWDTAAQRDAELAEFVDGIKRHYERAKQKSRSRSSKTAFMSKSIRGPHTSAGKKETKKRGRKRGGK
jgi:hypothetical protein